MMLKKGVKSHRALRKPAQKIKKSREYSINLCTDYNVLRSHGIKDRGNNLIDLAGVINFQILNKIRELDLKRRVAQGKKVRVAFFLDSVSKFTGANVYRAMLEDDLFEPFVVLYTLYEHTVRQDEYWREYQADLASLRDRGFTVLAGFDQDREFISMEAFKPDIVFISAFYQDMVRNNISGIWLNANFLVCQLNYGFNILNNYQYHYHNRQVNIAWKYFVETKEDFEELRRYSLHYGINTVYTGAPQMDDFKKPLAEYRLPDKIDNGRPIVVYAPHWTINYEVNVHDLATFHIHRDFFLELVKSRPDINFVFKPHPSLRGRLQGTGIMSGAEYDAYIERWASLPNGAYVFDDSFIGLFRRSSLLITDSASFILEWLPTAKPCIYLQNPARDAATWLDGFAPLAREALKTYYICRDREEILGAFNELLAGKDPRGQARAELAQRLFGDIGHAAKNIVLYLKRLLED